MAINKTASRVIHLDLDGVLADFRKGVLEAAGRGPETFSADELWALVATVPGFFLSLDVAPGAMALFSRARTLGQVAILTATPRASTYPTAADEKRRWTARHFGDIPFVAVRYARQKARFARPNDILVDDNVENIRQWEKAGGIGILHTELESTLASLSQAFQ